MNLLKSILRAGGARNVIAVTDALAAINVLATERQKIDCVISDHRLEGVSGLTLLQRIRAGRNPFIPRDACFIMMTGYSSEALVRCAGELDINGFVLKPASLDSTVKAIQLATAQKLKLKAAIAYAGVTVAEA